MLLVKLIGLQIYIECTSINANLCKNMPSNLMQVDVKRPSKNCYNCTVRHFEVLSQVTMQFCFSVLVDFWQCTICIVTSLYLTTVWLNFTKHGVRFRSAIWIYQAPKLIASDRRSGSDRRSLISNPNSIPNPTPNPSRSEPSTFSFNSLLSLFQVADLNL